MNGDLKSGVVEFEHFERLSNLEDFSVVQDFIDNPDLKENKLRITDFFQK